MEKSDIKIRKTILGHAGSCTGCGCGRPKAKVVYVLHIFGDTIRLCNLCKKEFKNIILEALTIKL